MPDPSVACEQCRAPLISLLYCFGCDALQFPSGEVTPHEALGIPESFQVDLDLLEGRYQQLTFELHPDFYANASKREQRQSELASAVLNRAYNTIWDPVARANDLLPRLAQGTVLDERQLPAGFLMEMFELQESLDDLLDSGTPDEIVQTRTDLAERHASLISGLALHFAEAEATAPPSTLQTLQTDLNAERYLHRLLERFPV